MRNKNSKAAFRWPLLWGIALYLSSCSGTEQPSRNEPGLVQEGMSMEDVRRILGDPNHIDSAGVIYNVDTETRQKVSRWHYEKRTIVLINDTVKSTDER
jgi:hypothetical protein